MNNRTRFFRAGRPVDAASGHIQHAEKRLEVVSLRRTANATCMAHSLHSMSRGDTLAGSGGIPAAAGETPGVGFASFVLRMVPAAVQVCGAVRHRPSQLVGQEKLWRIHPKRKRSGWRLFPMLGTLALLFCQCLGKADAAPADDRYVLENKFLGRAVSTAGGTLRTVEIINKRAGSTVQPTSAPEFRLRVSQGTQRPDTAFTLTAADFKVMNAVRAKEALVFNLENAAHQLRVEVRYELSPGEFYLRKRFTITSAQSVTLERIDVEALNLPDAYQPYTTRDITANAPGKWSPGLGQPLYASNSATFWGVEFPAADNQVKEGALSAGYLGGRELKADQPYQTYSAVMGVADDPAYVTEAFFDYIDRIRIRSLRLEVQYNSWFDYGGGVNHEKFAGSVAKIHRELVAERGNRPLNMYVIDDGWQDTGASWSDKVWKVNAKFDADFASSRKAVADAQGKLGLWLSPGCLFGAHGQVAKLRAQGFEALDDWMSMAGPRYMQALEDRMIELTRQGVGFFKLDGVFGHLNLRNFELHGAKYGLPEMPQLGLEGFTSGDKRLNDAKYDELKIYYLSAGTERLIRMFKKMAAADPDTFIVISNGAYLSPWWLMSVDAIWMINAGDAAGGSSRTAELVYRDGVYHEIWRLQHAQYPMCSIFNHEPKKTSTGEAKDEFRRYLYMHLSRGTGFVELYIKPFALQPGDWDVISEGLYWAEDVFPTFKRVRMHGGSPKAGEVYGYTAWDKTQGYISLHNPSADAKTYTVILDRAFGLMPGSGPFHVSSPLDDSVRGLSATCKFGETLAFDLKPREIRIVNFSAQAQDWTKLRQLQTRSPETLKVSVMEKPKATPIKNHPILGVWEYHHGGSVYTRTFGADGICTLRNGAHIEWEKPFQADGPDCVAVAGNLKHQLKPDGTLLIEGHYTARKRNDETKK
jgi:hypothetical protein